jgi:hypothetical protein
MWVVSISTPSHHIALTSILILFCSSVLVLYCFQASWLQFCICSSVFYACYIPRSHLARFYLPKNVYWNIIMQVLKRAHFGMVEAFASSWKVVGSIPNEVTGFFSSSNPSDHTKYQGSTQHLRETSTRNLPWGKGLLTTSPPFVSYLSRKMW